MHELLFIGLALLGFIYYLYDINKSTDKTDEIDEIDILETVPSDVKKILEASSFENNNESKTPPNENKHATKDTIPDIYVSELYIPESNDDSKSEMSVDDLLNQRHLNFFRFGYILDNGDEEQILRLFKRLFNEYKDYARIINIINKRKYLLENSQIKEIYEDSIRFINMDDKKHKALIEGWRT